MTVDQLISEVLTNIRNHFYMDRVREFKRDERALTRAIVRYGHECNQRGWSFDTDFIFRELMKLLLQIRTSKADIKYLPLYLDGAVQRSIGQHAEELSAAAKSLPSQVGRLIKRAETFPIVREPTAVEVCSAVFKALKRRKRSSRRSLGEAGSRQEKLLC